MRMRQGVRTGLGHGGITCVLQTQFSSFIKLFPFFEIGILFRNNLVNKMCEERLKLGS